MVRFKKLEDRSRRLKKMCAEEHLMVGVITKVMGESGGTVSMDRDGEPPTRYHHIKAQHLPHL
jgi:hypothetical protein